MAFNSTTYRMNQYRRSAWDNLARARDIKARAAHNAAYEWEVAQIPTFVSLARIDMKLHLSLRRLRKAIR